MPARDAQQCVRLALHAHDARRLRLLLLLAGVDVAQHRLHRGFPAVLDLHALHLDPDHRTVEPPNACLEGVGGHPEIQDAARALADDRPVGLEHEGHHRDPAQDRVGPGADQLARGGIAEQHFPAAVYQHRFGQGIDQRAIAALGLAALLLHALGLGEVMHHREGQDSLTLPEDAEIHLGGKGRAAIDSPVQPLEGGIAVAHGLLDALAPREGGGLDRPAARAATSARA